MTKSKVEEIFRIAGNVIEIELKTDKDGRSRGMCTVRYEHPMEAVQAIGILYDDVDDDRGVYYVTAEITRAIMKFSLAVKLAWFGCRRKFELAVLTHVHSVFQF